MLLCPERHWSIHTEAEFLVFRDTVTSGDHRIALAPRCENSKSIQPSPGNPHHPDQHSSTLAAFDGWQITEENSALCFRDTKSGGDHRFAIYPGCGNHVNYGNPHNPGRDGNYKYFVGKRWQIREESGGVLVFRDTLTEGDHRVAFYPNSGNGLWL